MPQRFKDIVFCVGTQEALEKVRAKSVMPVFSDIVVEFLDDLSKALFKNTEARIYPDIITFAFWCRKANVLSMKSFYENELGRLGRGVILHFAPSNVPVNFAYSLAAGILAGNSNIVRLSSKEFAQADIICGQIKKLLGDEKYSAIKELIFLIKYQRSDKVTHDLSSLCNVRVIWGGDDTINQIRAIPLPPRSTEVVFADRFSLCLINSDAFIKDGDYKKNAQNFYNDTYLSDQNACTAPKIIVWMGNDVNIVREKFWESVLKLVEEKYELKPIQAVNKLTALYKATVDLNVKLCGRTGSYLMRVEIDELTTDIIPHFNNSGYFYEYIAKELSEIIDLLTIKCQTMSYIGFTKNELIAFINKYRPLGVDRVVPVGKTMDFSLIWDGYDLINVMSRKIMFL